MSDVIDVTPPIVETAQPELDTPQVCKARMPGDRICGAGPHLTNPDMCTGGHFLPLNSAARTHGERGNIGRIPTELRQSADEFQAQVVADLGGLDTLTAIERGYVAKLCDTEVRIRLHMREIHRRGGPVVPQNGKPWPSDERLDSLTYLWDRLAMRLGLGRRARPVQSLQDYLRQAQAPSLEDGA
jgi:hypothetical protein